MIGENTTGALGSDTGLGAGSTSVPEKRAVTVNDEKIENRLFVKGAAEVVAQRCNRLKLENGRVVPITPVIRAQLDEKVGDPPGPNPIYIPGLTSLCPWMKR